MKPTIVLFLLISQFLAAQTGSIEGSWEGVASGVDEQGDTTWHNYALNLTQKESKISGTATVWFGEFWATMNCKGTQKKDGTFSIRETKITEQSMVPGFDFCLKSLILAMDETSQILGGFWEGKSKYGVCSPGDVLVWRRKE